jgi:hypothetical protein
MPGWFIRHASTHVENLGMMLASSFKMDFQTNRVNYVGVATELQI